MACDFEESASASSPNPAHSVNDVGDFECNICFELAQDPVVTLCGHLYCWPCLYRWLQHRSQCQECPVCKALIVQDKLVPLYGRGKTQTDLRFKSYPGMEIPPRPNAQRPQTAPPPEANEYSNFGLGYMGGFVPMATARLENFALASALGGIFPSILNIQVSGFPIASVNGATIGLPFAVRAYNGGYGHGAAQPISPEQQMEQQRADTVLKNIFLMIGICVILFVLSW